MEEVFPAERRRLRSVLLARLLLGGAHARSRPAQGGVARRVCASLPDPLTGGRSGWTRSTWISRHPTLSAAPRSQVRR